MDHKEATRIQAPARYLLGDLNPSEMEGFEEHFFECPECAEELRSGTVFADNVRAVLRERGRGLAAASPAGSPQYGRGWWTGFRPALAFAVPVFLAGVVIYQNSAVIPGLKRELAAARAPQPVPFFVLHNLSRAGGDQPIVLPPDSRFFVLTVDLAEEARDYVLEIRNQAGAALASFPASRSGSNSLLLDARQFPPGSYRVVVRSAAAPGVEVESLPFTLRQDGTK